MSCNNCCRVINRKTTSVTPGANLTLSIINVPNPIENNQKFRICIAQAIPSLVNPVQVVVSINGAIKALVDSCGNGVFSDQLRSRKIYEMTFATTLNGLVVSKCQLCCTRHVFAPTTIPVALNELEPEQP